MSSFQSPSDAPFQLKTEAETMTVAFKQGVPVTGQGTVMWNIPAPAQGCADGTKGAYCGMVFLLSNTPLKSSQAPVNGTFYEADPTADPDMHAGDQIDGAYVIGAFYEGDIINRGETPTTSFVLNDLSPNTPYYVAGYAVDCQGRYHREGIRAYSDDLGTTTDTLDTPATQVVTLNDTLGVKPTDGTHLVPGMTYEFELEINPNYPDKSSQTIVRFSDDGLNLGTYDDLVKRINRQLSLATNPLQSPVAPNMGRYYWDGTQLFNFDGTTNNPVEFINEAVDPANPQIGDYWYDGTSLQRWGTPTASVWNVVPHVEYVESPTNLTAGDDFWWDGTQGWKRCGNTWCQAATIVQTADPSLAFVPDNCGYHWFDTVNEILYEWNNETTTWDQTYAITWNSDPVNIADGSHWFDLATDKLYIRDTGAWVEIPLVANVSLATDPRLVISETEPMAPSANLYWYNATTEELKLYNDGTTSWDDVNVLVWENDPTVIDTCDLWWDSTSDQMYKWDVNNSTWNQQTFYVSAIDPTAPPEISVGTLWYQTNEDKMYRWTGVQWIEVTFIASTTDPTTPIPSEAWLNTETNEWFVWALPTPAQWNLIETIDTPNDPAAIPSGILWWDSTNSILYQRSGTSWIAVPYATNSMIPSKGTEWFNTTTNELFVWNNGWVPQDPLAYAFINEDGHLQFQTTSAGTKAFMMLLVPSGTVNHVNYNVSTGTAGHDFYNYGIYDYMEPTPSSLTPDTFLFDFIPGASINAQVYGTDGIDPTPSYAVVGVGDDGSPDERRRLADRIFQQLGAPTVDVEVTPSQMNIAIDLALSELRERTSVAYKRGFFFLQTQPHEQHYKLTDKIVGFNKIVTVMSAYRMTSAFLSSAHGMGLYGQVVLQHLYNMGTFDLLSYHLISQYVEQMEHLFATRLTYHWHESDRTLSFYQVFSYQEKILLDVMVERSEQELFTDRWTKNWIERFAYAEAMRILSQVRGKFATLPGAGGGVSLNASDLITQHDLIKEQLYQEIDDYVVNDVEDIGMESTMIIG